MLLPRPSMFVGEIIKAAGIEPQKRTSQLVARSEAPRRKARRPRKYGITLFRICAPLTLRFNPGYTLTLGCSRGDGQAQARPCAPGHGSTSMVTWESPGRSASRFLYELGASG